MLCSASTVNRYAASDGRLSFPSEAGSVSCAGAEAEATVAGGVSTLPGAAALELMPDLGLYDLSWGGVPVTVERVGARYCTATDVVQYGKIANDRFDLLDEDRISAAIQRAEETLERGCGRSFCRRALDVWLDAAELGELPVQDAVSISVGELVGDRQYRLGTAQKARVVYGARCDAALNAACVQLAAWYLRPRSGAENVRGTSQDGVYVSYELATGSDGSWTGLPVVDAIIEEHKSTRRLVA